MKKQLQLFLRKWILNPDRRYVLFIGISFGLAFLIPILGWNPLLLLWIVNGCLSYKEAKSNSIKIFNAVLVLLFGVIIYKYQGKDYPFYVNGQTGKITGSTPVSKKKVIAYGSTVFAVVWMALSFLIGIMEAL